MRAVIVYESMYGNTHTIADHIADGLRSAFDVTTIPVSAANAHLLESADLLVCGGPTHVHGLSRSTTRRAAVTATETDDHLVLDPDAPGPGIRHLFEHMDRGHHGAAAAFDTRVDAPAVITGRASRSLARRLRDHGYRIIQAPESFLVDKGNQLLEGETARARTWGLALVEAMAAARQN